MWSRLGFNREERRLPFRRFVVLLTRDNIVRDIIFLSVTRRRERGRKSQEEDMESRLSINSTFREKCLSGSGIRLAINFSPAAVSDDIAISAFSRSLARTFAPSLVLEIASLIRRYSHSWIATIWKRRSHDSRHDLYRDTSNIVDSDDIADVAPIGLIVEKKEDTAHSFAVSLTRGQRLGLTLKGFCI